MQRLWTNPDELNLRELRAELKKRGLSPSGLKHQLVRRLQIALNRDNGIVVTGQDLSELMETLPPLKRKKNKQKDGSDSFNWGSEQEDENDTSEHEARVHALEDQLISLDQQRQQQYQQFFSTPLSITGPNNSFSASTGSLSMAAATAATSSNVNSPQHQSNFLFSQQQQPINNNSIQTTQWSPIPTPQQTQFQFQSTTTPQQQQPMSISSPISQTPTTTTTTTTTSQQFNQIPSFVSDSYRRSTSKRSFRNTFAFYQEAKRRKLDPTETNTFESLTPAQRSFFEEAALEYKRIESEKQREDQLLSLERQAQELRKSIEAQNTRITHLRDIYLQRHDLIQFIDKTNLPKEILAGWQSDAGAKSASTNSSPELPHHQPQPVVV